MEQERLNLKIPKVIKKYLSEMAWRKRTSITGYLISLVKNDMNKNIDVVIKVKEEK